MRKLLNLIMLLLIVMSFLNCKDSSSTKDKRDEHKNDRQNNIEASSEKIDNTIFHYVTAINGLSVRKQPDINAEKISTLDYGTPVKIIEETHQTFQVKEGTKTIDGKWVLIDSKETTSIKGYVFDGFLTRENPMPYRLSNTDLNSTRSYNKDSDIDKYLILELISKKTYEELKQRQNNFITVREDTLEIKKNNGKIDLPTDQGVITLLDIREKDMGDASYHYLGAIDSLNVYVIRGDYIGYSEHLLINKATARKDTLAEKPIISPNWKKMITASIDGQTLAPTDLQLFDIEKNKYVLRLMINFQGWFHSQEEDSVFWINKDEFCMKIMSLQHAENEGFKEHCYQYIKIKVLY
ncbi:SH3 domain-containing protein [Aquimarina megaterium]|uniref:SH3 domain-containing protein n=1 Tax=Aquimarina megaterium TaxID=1443666 RepID=UPI0009DF4AA1|nr:SH3 domain-containing protein [Aquimarina megaterium]